MDIIERVEEFIADYIEGAVLLRDRPKRTSWHVVLAHHVLADVFEERHAEEQPDGFYSVCIRHDLWDNLRGWDPELKPWAALILGDEQ
jgi:hypothetical protein